MFGAIKFFTGFLAFGIALAFVIWVCGFIVFTGTVSSMNEPKNIDRTDAVIALTGGTNRITRALDFIAEGKADYLLISGVNKGVKMRELLKLWGYKKPLPDGRIALGYEAESTLGNALEARKWVSENHIKSIRLITATYHMPRAMLEFHHALPGVKIAANPVIPENFLPSQKRFWNLCFLEYHKFIISLVRVTFYPWEIHPMPTALK